MWFRKFYTVRTNEYIYKIVLSSDELQSFRDIVKKNMDQIDYLKLNIKPFNITEERKYQTSVNSIGKEAIDNIELNNLKYFTIELTENELFELFEECFYLMIVFKQSYNMIKELCEIE